MEIKSNKYWNFPNLFLFVFMGFTLLYLTAILVFFQLNYDISCPNKEFLTWDPSLRFIQTLQMMDNLRNFRIFSFFYQILDSPTWPVLRNLIQIPVFFLFGIYPGLDAYITFFFLILLFIISGIYIFKEISGKYRFFLAPVFFLIYTILILLSPPIVIYTFTGMLEVQGALFFIISIFALSTYYIKKSPASKWYILFSGLFLFHTKYPYGYMYVVSVLLFQFILSPKNFFDFFLRYAKNKISRFWNFSGLLLAILLTIVVLLPISNTFPGKMKNYIKFLIFLILSSDFILYFFKNKKDLLTLGFEKLIFIFQWIVFPVLFWVLIHPDRFSSSGSTIAHVQTEGLQVGQVVEKNLSYYMIYLNEISTNAYEIPLIGLLALCISLFALIRGYYLYKIKSEIDPSFLLSFFILTPIVFLTFLTSNHQARHIYHLIPAITLCILFTFYDLIKDLPKIYFVGLTTILLFSALYFSISLNTFTGIANVCFAGKDRNAYDLPSKVKNRIKDSELLSKNTILINDLNPIHVNRADVELIFNLSAYEKNRKLITNPKNEKKILDFEELIFVGNDCLPKESMFKFQTFPSAVNFLKKNEIVQETNLCMIHFKLQSGM